MSSDKGLFNFPFSHIYVEEKAKEHPLTKEILSWYKKSQIIPIRHHKDVFNRPRQSFLLQKIAPSIILARNPGVSVFKGAPVCQDIG
ncbi:MAG: radical SAM protein, partial [Clostridiales bacterium]|nr:radical SAM protein [Clostridiales bacterium]